jgi:2-C-methyl-D-erythritol 2,4-cyclodiphosphate synthase
MYRVGIGYDIHRFALGRKLFIGGVRIPFKKGLRGHSDADVLVHAVCDALLGALGSGDIGEHFPNTDARFRGISSLKLLKVVSDLLRDKGARVVNIDTMVVMEAPKIGRYKEKMKAGMAKILGTEKSRVSVKATTNEGTGMIGKGEAAAAYAAVLLEIRRLTGGKRRLG